MTIRQAASLALGLLLVLGSVSAANAAPTENTTTLHALVKQATVRLRVLSGNVAEYGSGTVVDRVGNTGLVVTCAHIFDVPNSTIHVTFFNGEKRILDGTLLARNEKWDVALVRVENIPPVTPIPLAPPQPDIHTGQGVMVAGCDEGGPPNCWDTEVTAINRFYGRPNLEVAAIPEDGRSGGGLISEELRLLGVCNGVNTLEFQGLYAGVLSVHQLAKTVSWRDPGLSNSLALTSATTPPRPTKIDTRSGKRGPSMENDTGYEVICIIRKKSESKNIGEVIELRDVSPVLIDAIRKADADSR